MEYNSAVDVPFLLDSIELNEPRFLSLLEKLIGETRHLQNSPAQGLIPQEDLAAKHVLDVLTPFSVENGGPLILQKINFVDGRANVIIRYPGTTDYTSSFVGSHLDVVPAAPDGWDRDPFKLEVDGDRLYGRGTTDCLGHVAMLTDFFASLAEKRPLLKRTIACVFIANEENGTFKGIGVDQLSIEGYLDSLKNGPVFWIDAADGQPCMGTAGNMVWKLEITGKLFHSGMPHRSINPIEMGMDTMLFIQNRFYSEFPRLPQEDVYNFSTGSTMKPTQISCTPGSLNQIPPLCTIEGDIRLSPFYDVKDANAAVQRWVDEINADPAILHGHHGPHSKYTLPEENLLGRVKLSWQNEGENGIACDMESPGFKALFKATEEVIGEAIPYSIGGSLPLVREMKDKGFDLQIAGYGLSVKYHADNEYASLSGLKKATKVIAKLAHKLETEYSP